MVNHYTLDPARSRFTVQAFATGMLSGFAHSPAFIIRRFQGEIEFSPDNENGASLRMTVEAASLELKDAVKEKDRQEIQRAMLDEVLEVGKYREITFRSTTIAASKLAENWYRAQIRGDMQLHGVTKPVNIDSQLRLSEGEVRLSGDFPLSLTAFRIKPVSAMGGMIKLKDELKFVFDLVGREQEQQPT
jgi:polyisoprenoid-binding protein YceI